MKINLRLAAAAAAAAPVAFSMASTVCFRLASAAADARDLMAESSLRISAISRDQEERGVVKFPRDETANLWPHYLYVHSMCAEIETRQ